MASLQTETSAALQKPDRYNLRFLTETNFIKLKRVKWPQPRPRFKQTLQCNCIRYFIFFRDFSIQLLGNPDWKLFQFIFQTETLFLLLDRVSYCRRGHSITTFYKTHLSTSSTRRFTFWNVPNNLSFLFNLPSTVGVKMLQWQLG